LGKYSALWELNWLKQKAGTPLYPSLRYYYLGSYVHSCHKVNYKAEYGPAELLCPITLQWVTLQSAKQVLDQQTAEIKFTRLANLQQANHVPESPLSRQEISDRQEIDNLAVVYNNQVQRFGDVSASLSQYSKAYNMRQLGDIVQAANALGRGLAFRVAFAARFDLDPDGDGCNAGSDSPRLDDATEQQLSGISDEETDQEAAFSERDIGLEYSPVLSRSNSADQCLIPGGATPEGAIGAVGDFCVGEQPTPKKPKIYHKG
jgi:hypothetical protein